MNVWSLLHVSSGEHCTHKHRGIITVTKTRAGGAAAVVIAAGSPLLYHCHTVVVVYTVAARLLVSGGSVGMVLLPSRIEITHR